MLSTCSPMCPWACDQATQIILWLVFPNTTFVPKLSPQKGDTQVTKKKKKKINFEQKAVVEVEFT